MDTPRGARLFGTVRLTYGSASTDRFPTTKCHELIAFLTLARGKEMQRATVCRALWPDDPVTSSSRNRLSVTIYMLRKSCEAQGVPLDLFLKASRQTMSADPLVDIDYFAFDKAAKHMHAATEDAVSVEHAKSIVAHYRGPLGEGISAPWLTALRADARSTFEEAVLIVAKSQSQSEAADTIRAAILIDLDSEGAVTTFLEWATGRGSQEVVEKIMKQINNSQAHTTQKTIGD